MGGRTVKRQVTEARNAVSEWRASLREHDAILADDADELEAHVRESAGLHVAFGASPDEAAEIAVREIGDTAEIAAEYDKEDPNRVWRRPVRRMLVGPLVIAGLLRFCRWAAYGVGISVLEHSGPDRGRMDQIACGATAVALTAGAIGGITWLAAARRAEGFRHKADRRCAWVLGSRRARRVAAGALVVTAVAVGVATAPGRTYPYGTLMPLATNAGRAVYATALLMCPVALWPGMWLGRDAATRGAASLWRRRLRWMVAGQAAMMLMALALEAAPNAAAWTLWTARARYSGVLGAYAAAVGAVAVGELLLVFALVTGRPSWPRRWATALGKLWGGGRRRRKAALCATAGVVVALAMATAAVSFMDVRSIAYVGMLEAQVLVSAVWRLLHPLVSCALVLWLVAHDIPARSQQNRKPPTTVKG